MYLSDPLSISILMESDVPSDIHDIFKRYVPRHALIDVLHNKDFGEEFMANLDIGTLIATQETLDDGGKSSDPISVVSHAGNYFVIDGHHRIAEILQSGGNKVQAKVQEYV